MGIIQREKKSDRVYGNGLLHSVPFQCLSLLLRERERERKGEGREKKEKRKGKKEYKKREMKDMSKRGERNRVWEQRKDAPPLSQAPIPMECFLSNRLPRLSSHIIG